jgi:deoxyribodipyrimidine photo-lyase
MSFDLRRIISIRESGPVRGPVFYWMSRDQRAADNWALIYAQTLAIENKVPLAVVFCLVPKYLEATMRQYGFMLRGLEQVQKELESKDIPFFLVMGDPDKKLPAFLKKHKAGALVTDFNPLRLNRKWKQAVADKIVIPFYEVDAHNIVPVRIASDKREFAAYTIRPKITRLLQEFLLEFPALKKHRHKWQSELPKIEWKKAWKSLEVDTSVAEIDWLKPGGKAALKTLRNFLEKKLTGYDEKRNLPTEDFQSDLSPYLHFGQIAPQRVALETLNFSAGSKSQEAFLEQIIIRRELADNFCYYNSDYDNFDGFADWAKESLTQHRNDPREYIYTLEEFESAATHDELWNAAQMEMVLTGKMHGYLRMYWAKKILEWSISLEEAMRITVYLNDRYELDGRDPNGYAGIAWSIGGVHDRPWFEREVFGKIRFMSYNGCKRKFDIQAYINKVNNLKPGVRA